MRPCGPGAEDGAGGGGGGGPGTARRGAWGLHLGVHRLRSVAHSKRNSPPFQLASGKLSAPWRPKGRRPRGRTQPLPVVDRQRVTVETCSQVRAGLCTPAREGTAVTRGANAAAARSVRGPPRPAPHDTPGGRGCTRLCPELPAPSAARGGEDVMRGRRMASRLAGTKGGRGAAPHPRRHPGAPARDERDARCTPRRLRLRQP